MTAVAFNAEEGIQFDSRGICFDDDGIVAPEREGRAGKRRRYFQHHGIPQSRERPGTESARLHQRLLRRTIGQDSPDGFAQSTLQSEGGLGGGSSSASRRTARWPSAAAISRSTSAAEMPLISAISTKDNSSI